MYAFKNGNIITITIKVVAKNIKVALIDFKIKEKKILNLFFPNVFNLSKFLLLFGKGILFFIKYYLSPLLIV